MSNLAFIANYGSSGSGNSNVSGPYGLDTDGVFLYIADEGNSRILKWRLNGGSYTAQSEASVLDSPRDVLFWKDLLFVVDTANHRIAVHRARDLKQIKTFGSQGSGNSQFNTPTSICTDGKFLYITDSTNTRVVKYDLRTLTFDSKVTMSSSPHQICYDSHEKTLYIANFGADNVLKRQASDLSAIETLAASASVDATFTQIRGVAVKSHYLYVVEKNRIQVFDTATLTTRNSAGSDGSGNSNIAQGGYVKAHRNVLLFTDQSNHRMNVWYNHAPARAFESGDTRVITGAWWQNPIIPIGGSQEGELVTIEGTDQADLLLNIEEEKLNDNYAGVRES